MSKKTVKYAGPFEQISFYLGRAYYDHIRLLEQLLKESRLDKHLGPGMGQILFNLFDTESMIIKELIARVRLSPSHLTAVLGRMEEKKLIKRRRDPQDGRAVRISLTPLGQSLKKKCGAMLKRLNTILARGMSDREIKAAKKSLDRIVENIRDYRKN